MTSGAERFRLNPSAQAHVETTAAGCPVLIVDDFYADPHAVRAAALEGRYDASLAYYPGMHSAITPSDLRPLFAQLAQLLALLGDVRCSADDFTSDFSIVTTPAREMLAKQKHPHVDPMPLAGVVYLNPDFEIGTSMFRHIPLDLAILRTEEEHARYSAWLEADGERTQPETYAVGNDGIWEHLHTVSGRFNRLAMYPGNAFHSIAMTDVAANPTLDKARLTQRLFVSRVTPISV